ncbi:MAG: iron ABC transporter permease [Flavobacteriales bacterium]
MRLLAPGLMLMLVVASLALLLAGLLLGPVPILPGEVFAAVFAYDGSSNARIVREVRLPSVVTAWAAGAGSAASGALMQTLFRNPLAGPSVLGISSGASLGVAIVLLLQPLWAFAPGIGDLALILAAAAGGIGVLLLMLLADRRLGDTATLLIVGLMVGYLCSAAISVLELGSGAGPVKGFVHWGMGSFAGVPLERLPWLLIPVLVSLVISFLLVKPLNALLLGPDAASTLGTDVPKARRSIMWTAGLLASVITAFCGPIAFLGLATPHLARALVRTGDHVRLLPVTVALGGALAMACDLIVRWPGTDGALPLNAVTSLIGGPVVLWVLLRRDQWSIRV